MSKLDLDSKAKQAFDDVSNSKLTYALLKHEGTSNKVIVASTGDDILDLIDDLNDGTIMYALIRFVINDATKFVYVGWCPEGIANQIFKGKFQNWNKDMEFYLKGRYHLSVYARNEEDIDQASWIKKLKVGAGSSYTQSSNAKDLTISQAKQNIASSKTDVKKTEVAIDDSERNKFWEKQQEELKKQEEKKKLPPPRSDYKKTDERNQFWQGQSTSTTSGSTVVKSSDRISEIQQIKNNSNQFWQKQQEQPVPESDNKPKEVVRGNKDLFKKFESMSVKTEESKPVARQPISTGAAKKPVFQPKHEEPVYEEPQHHYEEPVQEESHYEHYEEPQQEESHYEEPPQQTYHQPRVPPPFHQPRYDSEEEEEPEQEPEPVQEPVNNKPSKPKGYLERQVEQGNISPSQAEEIIAKPTKLPPPPVPTKPKYPELVAVFDFEGQDGEELSFAEGDTLYLVQDEGEWWLAEDTNGQQGYIPSNYVEYKE